MAAMLKPGGFVLSSDKLAATDSSGLKEIMTTEMPVTGPPVMTDYIFCYQRE